MKRTLLLFCLFEFSLGFLGDPSILAFFGTSKELTVIPDRQFVNEYEDVVIDCIDPERGKVHWGRPKGLPWPTKTKQFMGRLYVNNIKRKNEGIYICESEDRKRKAEAVVTVVKRPTSAFRYEVTTGLPVTSNPYWTTTPAVTTPYPCMYGICNGTCCAENNAVDSFFDCADGQKISKSLVCNRVNDCKDGSDESRCEPWPPKITVLPKDRVDIYCGEQGEAPSGTLVLECQSVGNPTPVIKWKKYEGHVPTKCQQISRGGHGVLTCPDFQQSDQGAYSCVAENSVKQAESQPKSIAKCKNTINCKGFRVIIEKDIEHCLECYCSGRTNQCNSIKSIATPIKIPFPQGRTEIFAKENGEILFVPTRTKLIVDSKIRELSQEITYCSLSESELPEKSFLKSFGRNVIFPRHKGKANFLEEAPDLIIRGNGLSLMYTVSRLYPIQGNIMDVTARFWPGNWHHLNKTTAKRHDLMRVLSNMDTLLIRCEYEQGKTLNLNKTASIIIESSTITDNKSSVSFVEKCSCPPGYDGLSCESCATGYEKKVQGNSFICEKINVPIVCKTGYVGDNCTSCDTAKGYHKKGDVCVKAVCHPEGALSVFLDNFQKCKCRERVTGEFCDRCENGSFHLHKERGCIKCWCSGVTDDCKSSKLYKTVISNIPRGGYNSSDGRNFWLLPTDFNGNRLTSYGGHLNYSMKYKSGVPKENTPLTVEFLSMSDITLVYTHSTVDRSSLNTEKSWSVPLTEIHWRKEDKSTITRGEFLTVLSQIKAIYIESPYHLSSGIANLTSARMSSASSSGDGQNILAVEVEQCNCPPGYTGLSCEKCSEGYYKKRNGSITQCIKCNCSYCDPDFGCPDCPELHYRDNPEHEKMPVCKPCPCNNNGISCLKDDFGQIFCRCKPGFTGMHCENELPKERNDLTITISPRRISGRRAGTTVSYNCSFISSEEMTFYLLKNYHRESNNRTHVLLGTGSNVSKTVDVLLEAELKSVECTVYDAKRNAAGHVMAVVDDLIVQSEPVKITNCYSDRIDVKESESRDIICQATGSPKPMVNWYRTRHGSETEKVDTSDGVHTIESASLSDNGTVYNCIAENSLGDKAACTMVLIVQKKCEIINIFPSDVRMVEGESAVVQCTTTAKSPVAWLQLDTFFNKVKSIASTRIQVDKDILRINNASLEDSGIYICTADGANEKLNKTLNVTVVEKRVPPTVSIQEDDQTLKVGERFDIHCIVTGKPTPQVTWLKLNDSLEDNVKVWGKTLNINKAIVENSGIYGCEARSVAGNATAFIAIQVEDNTIKPRVNISEETIEAHAGEEVTVSCLAIGYPRPTLTWYSLGINFKDSRREIDNMILLVPQESIKETKTFTVTNEMEGKTITCMGFNSAGNDTKKVTIKVLQPKVQFNGTADLVEIGSFYKILCDFPGNLEWEKVGSSFVGDECIFTNMLVIPSVQIQHNGTYRCKDKSGIKKEVYVVVTGFAPKFSKAAKSFVVLPVELKLPSDIRVALSFNAAHENGVILQEATGKLSIYLEKGKIRVSIFTREQDTHDIALSEEIALQKWYSLIVSVSDGLIDITMYDEKSSIYGRRSEKSKDFNIQLTPGSETFFVGGPIPRARHHTLNQFRRHHYFDGCVSRLSINRYEYDIVSEGSHSQNVTLCRMCSRLQNPCGDRGKCLDAPTQYGFICVCPESTRNDKETCSTSCKGKGCENQLNLCTKLNPCKRPIHQCTQNTDHLHCQCAFGYSGTTCERVQEYSFCTKGDGYVTLPSALLERQVGIPEIIRMSFTLEKPNGQLLWQGDKANHLSISVEDGRLRYVYSNQRSKLEINTEKKLSLDKKHLLAITRMNNTVTLKLNLEGESATSPKVYRNATATHYTNRVVGDIYLGNVPKNSLHIGNHVGLKGCINYISFGNSFKVNLPEKEVERVNASPLKNQFQDTNSDESIDYNDDDLDLVTQGEESEEFQGNLNPY